MPLDGESRRVRTTIAILAATLLASVLASCASPRSREISFSEFRDYGDTPIEHTFYIGSDPRFHYFVWSVGKSSGRWHVPRSSFAFQCERPYGETSVPLFTDEKGRLQPWLSGCIPDSPGA